jgi:hypothetical protein
MSSPSILGDHGLRVTATFPLSTSTAIYYAKASGTSTGTKKTTSRTLDLSRLLHYGTTGGKPLDSTVHPRKGGPPRFKSVAVAVPLELTFHTSGLQAFVTVAHLCRAATSGAGSTWRTLKSDVRRFTMGTDTDATFHTGFVSSCNYQAGDRYYKANITFATRKASDTSAKDTTTGTEIFCNSPVVMLHGGDEPQNKVPAQG